MAPDASPRLNLEREDNENARQGAAARRANGPADREEDHPEDEEARPRPARPARSLTAMVQRCLDGGTEPGGTLVCGLTPRGRIDVHPASPDDGPRLSSRVRRRILTAFENGRGHGVLQLGAGELNTDLHPTLSYWRDIGKQLVAKACGALDPTAPQTPVVPEPDADELAAFVEAAPPMQGAERITPALVVDLWRDAGDALATAAARHADGVQGYLREQSPVWNVVGRVCFHLAENKRDPAFPFAFIATYVHKVSKQATPQHLPLGRALEEYAGARNRQKLLALLSPLSRAAEQSAFVRELVDAGDIYHPLSWTPADAHRFLSEIPLYEQAGLVVRMPDWWSARNRPRPKVSVALGGQAPSTLGLDALLDFDVRLTLDGEDLSQEEIASLLAASEGLVLIRGKWVEVERDQLRAVLDQWRDVQRQARADGVPFGEAMRMLAGVAVDGGGSNGLDDIRPEWSEVVAGKWLGERLDALRSPELRAEIDAGAGLRATLRPYQKLGVQWLWTLRGLALGGCLADDMGLGKTIQVLALLSLCRRGKERGTDLLVVPASLIDNWLLEIERFAPGLKVLIAHPSRIPSPELKKLRRKAVAAHDAVITTYGTAMRTEWMQSHDWRNVILDEAQAIKNPAAKQTRAVKALDSRWRAGADGHAGREPPGRPVVDLRLPEPGAARLGQALSTGLCKLHGGGPITFRLRAAAAAGAAVYPETAQDRQGPSSPICRTRPRSRLLPAPRSARQPSTSSRSTRWKAGARGAADGIQRRGVVLAFLMRFKQICNHPSQWLGDGEYEAARQRQVRASRRAVRAELAARQDKVLVFTQFREMIAPLSSFLEEVFGTAGLVLHGGTAGREAPGDRQRVPGRATSGRPSWCSRSRRAAPA